MTEATVDIVEAVPDTVKIQARDLDPELHQLLDTHGRVYDFVIHKRRKTYLWTKRSDGWVDVFADSDILTVKLKEA